MSAQAYTLGLNTATHSENGQQLPALVLVGLVVGLVLSGQEGDGTVKDDVVVVPQVVDLLESAVLEGELACVYWKKEGRKEGTKGKGGREEARVCRLWSIFDRRANGGTRDWTTG